MTTTTADSILEQPYFMGLQDYIRIARRRWIHCILPAALVFLAAFAYVMSIPPIYRSVASISVESQQIPSELVQSTVSRYSNQQIEFIRQLVLTRQNVRNMVQKFGLYQGLRLDENQKIERFLANVEIQIASSEGYQFSSTPALSFDVAFLSASPVTAQKVTQELVELFLNENARSRTRRAAETTAFLAEEAEKIRTDMLEMEQRVAEFKRVNRNSLPSIAAMSLTLMDRLENDYSDTSQRIEGLKGQLSVLRLEADQYRERLIASASGLPSVATLQRQYDEILIRNTENHPDARRLKRQIDDLKARLQQQKSGESTPDDAVLLEDSTYMSYRTRIESIEHELTFLKEQKQALASRMDEVQRRIEEAPRVEKELTDLERDLNNLRANYEEMRDKELEARIAQSLEEGEKGERFTLLEPPIFPVDPYKPDRLKLVLAAIVFSGAIGFGIVVLLELSSSGLPASGIQHALGGPPMVTIPFIDNSDSIRQKRRKLTYLAAFVILFFTIVFAILSRANY